MEKLLSELITLLWKECIQIPDTCLDADEVNKFLNNDYYYLVVIDSLKNPNFTETSEALGLTKPAISSMIKKFSSIGLVTNIQLENNRRIFNIIIFERGRKIVDGDYKMYQQITDIINDVVMIFLNN